MSSMIRLNVSGVTRLNVSNELRLIVSSATVSGIRSIATVLGSSVLRFPLLIYIPISVFHSKKRPTPIRAGLWGYIVM